MSDPEERESVALFGADQRRVVVDPYCGDDRWLALVHVEGDAHGLAMRRHRCVDRCLAIAASPVVNANAQDVALKLLPIEIVLLDEDRRLADKAERKQQRAVAPGCLRGDALLEIVLVDMLHAA